ncbi:MAG: hypothetical protein GEU71_02605 [Actinobacteria bacterium]|jgi:hypothetical protein|nr:hypothetical protein [Actinomycetota bacterium]
MKALKPVPLVVMIAVLLSAAPASAAKMEISDPNDVRGKLDLRRVIRSGEDKLTWRLITYKGWSVKEIWSVGTLVVDLDTRFDSAPDYYVTIFPTHDKLKARLFRDRKNKKDYQVGKVKVWRKNRKSASIQLSLSRVKVGDDRATYSWRAQTLYYGSSACSDVCFDMAPQNDAWVTEPLPVP